MKKVIFLGYVLLLGGAVFAQSASPEVVGAAGEHYENATYQLDWTVGEIATETYSDATYTLTQGFHQPGYTVTEVENPEFKNLNITAYPNPASDFITLEKTDEFEKDYKLELIDLSGKVFLSEKFNENKKQLGLSALTNGVYFINVKSNNNIVKSFKIIKH